MIYFSGFQIVIFNYQTAIILVLKEFIIMKFISITLLILGILALFISTMAFGDIGIAIAIGGLTSLLSGIGFWVVDKRLP